MRNAIRELTDSLTRLWSNSFHILSDRLTALEERILAEKEPISNPQSNSTVSAKPLPSISDPEPAPKPPITKKLSKRLKRKQVRASVCQPAPETVKVPDLQCDNKEISYKNQSLVTTDNNPRTESRWTEVKRKSVRRYKSADIIRGTAKPGISNLEASEKVKFFHLFYVKYGTTEDQVRMHLANICATNNCSVEALKSRGNYASFKIGVPDKLSSKVLIEDNWAAEICIKPWKSLFRGKFEKKES
ncbi:unnamed protein product [Colias eurytheme]|nr:unnamed protein product [Colias eurytheme]